MPVQSGFASQHNGVSKTGVQQNNTVDCRVWNTMRWCPRQTVLTSPEENLRRRMARDARLRSFVYARMRIRAHGPPTSPQGSPVSSKLFSLLDSRHSRESGEANKLHPVRLKYACAPSHPQTGWGLFLPGCTRVPVQSGFASQHKLECVMVYYHILLVSWRKRSIRQTY